VRRERKKEGGAVSRPFFFAAAFFVRRPRSGLAPPGVEFCGSEPGRRSRTAPPTPQNSKRLDAVGGKSSAIPQSGAFTFVWGDKNPLTRGRCYLTCVNRLNVSPALWGTPCGRTALRPIPR
jgi:hypothetical protein